MQEILNLLVLLAILSCGLSVMLSPMTGKKGLDPFLLIRPLARWVGRQPGRFARGTSKALRASAKSSWRRARNGATPLIEKLFLYPLSVVLGILCIPGIIIGEKKK